MTVQTRPSGANPRHHLLKALLLVTLSIACINTNAAVTKWVNIKIEDGALWLETKVGGVDGYSMIDSGAQINAINGNFLRASGQSYRTGRAITIRGILGSEQRSSYHSIPVELFGSSINFKGLVDIDFGGENAQLILGAPFLKLYVFQFDYPNKRMRFITRDSINLKKQKNVKSELDYKTRDPIVKVNMNDEKNIWLQLDTGNNGGVLIERQVAASREWLEKFPTEIIDVRGATTSGQTERFNLPTFEIGGFELSNVIINVPPKGKSFELFERETKTGSRLRQKRSKSQGILGYDVLKHFVVTIDYKGGHVHLEAPVPQDSTTE